MKRSKPFMRAGEPPYEEPIEAKSFGPSDDPQNNPAGAAAESFGPSESPQDKPAPAAPQPITTDETSSSAYRLPAAGERPILIRSVPIAGLHACCRCGHQAEVHEATDGHLYCGRCRTNLVDAGIAQVGGYATVEPHGCQSTAT